MLRGGGAKRPHVHSDRDKRYDFDELCNCTIPLDDLQIILIALNLHVPYVKQYVCITSSAIHRDDSSTETRRSSLP